ncbi:MAG TPA: hypothetical protein VGC56_06720 [Allosphingosinicella sp.]|jgi:hypothetical protein
MPAISKTLLNQLPVNDIPEDLPSNFRPEQVVYRRLTRFPHGTPRYAFVDVPTKIPSKNFTTIEVFVSDIAKNGHKLNDPDIEENNYLDLTIGRDSYIVIELDHALGCYFTTSLHDGKQEGIALLWLSDDDPNPLSYYGQLKYVDDTGKIYDDPAPLCRIAYFAAKPIGGPGVSYEQRIAYFTDWPGGTHQFDDPDIRFPGNGSG